MMPAIMQSEITGCSQFHEGLPTGIDASHPLPGKTRKHQCIVAGLALPHDGIRGDAVRAALGERRQCLLLGAWGILV
jgi:hypothetical protein